MEQKQKPRVLVLDADMVPALTISRSLSHRNCVVDVASDTINPLISYSNSVNAVFQYPDPLAVPDLFVQWLLEHTQNTHYDLVIPVTERSLVALSEHRGLLSDVRLAMPSTSWRARPSSP